MAYNTDVIKWHKTYGPKKSVSIGTEAPGFSAEHFTADGYHYVTKLTVNKAFPDIPGGASLGVGLLAFTFPAGVHALKFAGINIALTQTDGFVDADTPELALGTVIVEGAVATMSTGTWENILTAQVMNNCTGTAEVMTLVVPDAGIVSLAAGIKAVYLNIADAWASSGDDALLATGTIYLQWVKMS